MIILTWRRDICLLIQWLILGFETEFTNDLREQLKEGFQTTVSVQPTEVLTSMYFSTYYLAPGSQSHSFLDSSAGPLIHVVPICVSGNDYFIEISKAYSFFYFFAKHILFPCLWLYKKESWYFRIQKIIVSESILFFKLSPSTLTPTSKQVKE